MTVLLPARSDERNCSVCAPSPRAESVGEAEQAAKPAPSRSHACVAVSETAIRKAGVVSLVSTAGAAVNEALGAVRSTRHVYEAVPTFAAASVLRTAKVCVP